MRLHVPMPPMMQSPTVMPAPPVPTPTVVGAGSPVGASPISVPPISVSPISVSPIAVPPIVVGPPPALKRPAYPPHVLHVVADLLGHGRQSVRRHGGRLTDH